MPRLRDRIAELLEEGVSLSEIARRLDVAGPTVAYHVGRLQACESDAPVDADSGPSPEAARRHISTRALVAELLAAGLSRAEVARRLGLTKSTVSYHARRLDHPIDVRCARRYDWDAVQRYYDLGHSARECRARFGFASQTWHEARKRGAIVTRPAAMPSGEYFAAGVHRSRYNLKLRLLKEGLKEPRCEHCGISEWRGQPLSLALHHVNGDRNDHRVENLMLLCGNCHSQTPNFSGRKPRSRVSEPEAEAA